MGIKKQKIELKTGFAHETLKSLEQAFLQSGVQIYQRGDQLVRPNESNLEGDLIPVDKHWIWAKASEVCTFKKFNSSAQGLKNAELPLKIAEAYVHLKGDWQVPKLRGIARCPLLRLDGSLLNKPGYDPQTQLLAIFPSEWQLNFPKLKREDARQALKELRALVVETPFKSEADEAVFFSALLSAINAPTLLSVLLHFFSGRTPGSGKSLLATLICLIATGLPESVLSWGTNDDESEKRFNSAILSGKQIITIDNIERPLKSDVICSYATQQIAAVRALGNSKLIEVPTTAYIQGTGNNLVIAGDLNRRSLVSLLDPAVERPENRVFKTNPLKTAQEKRFHFIKLCLTVQLAYIQNGCPNCGTSPIGSFENWSKFVRNPLVWAGLPDPCTVMERTRKQDPEQELALGLLHAWKARFGSRIMTVKAIISDSNAELQDALAPLRAQNDFNRTIGHYLSRIEGRIFEDMRIERYGQARGVTQWQLQERGAFEE